MGGWPMATSKRIILGVSGASGVILAYHTALALKENKAERHLVVSDSARLTWELESTRPFSDLTDLADVEYDVHNIAASISSGSFETDGMLIVPCSMKTLAGIVTGYTDNLLLRAADVCMKEGRPLVLCPREMPLSKLHLQNLCLANELGCTIIPPMLTFYSNEQSVQDHINHIVGKLLRPFGLHSRSFQAWHQPEAFE